jgi:hypothetical protein
MVFNNVIESMKEGECDSYCMFGLIKSDHGYKGDFEEESDESDEEFELKSACCALTV